MTSFSTKRSPFIVRVWRWALKCLLLSVLCGCILTGAVIYFAFEKTPLLHSGQPVNSQDARIASEFVKRISRKVISTHQPISIKASQSEINSTLRLIHRTNSGFVGTALLTQKGAEFRLSLRSQWFNKTYYLNGIATLQSSPDGFKWKNSKIGSLPLYDRVANFLFSLLVEAALGKEYGQNILAGISDIAITPSHINIVFQPPEGFQEGIANVVERLNSYSGQDKKFHSARVQHYLDVLIDHTRGQPQAPVSLTEYLELLINESKSQSAQYDHPLHHENLAALYALGIQVGPGIFRHFIADIKLNRLNATPQPQLTLLGRADLAKHFVYSSALKILAERGFSFSLGELKEIMDANGGGSGFSFVDITADKVGIRYTELAIGSAENAHILARIVKASFTEKDYFPDVSSLPEGLNEEEFKHAFTDIESDTYQALLSEIELRIDNTPLFKNFTSAYDAQN